MAILLLAIPDALLTAADLAAVQALAGDMTVLVTSDEEEIEAHLGEIEVACYRFPRRLLARAPQLRWFQQWGAGADWLLQEPAIQALPFVLTNASGVHPIQISEHILATMLALARKLPTAVRAQLQGAWTLDDRQLREQTLVRHDVFELAGKTVLLVGVGAIGARTARLCAALEMAVWGVRRGYPPAGGPRQPPRGTRGAARAAARRRFRCSHCAADAGNAPPDRRRSAGGNEVDELPGQYRPRRPRRRAGADRRSADRHSCRRRARCFRNRAAAG